MFTEISPERLADLLREPREDLGCEIKGWLDLQSNNDHKATFAKAVLALANHGGGFIVLGLDGEGLTYHEATDRPANLNGYGQDLVNGIVRNYCDPPFHCSVHNVRDPNDAVFPVVVVPGGHRGPILSCRAGPNGKLVKDSTVYMRKLGPSSATPQTSAEWRELIERWVANRRDEMAEQIRNIVLGNVPSGELPTDANPLESWVDTCLKRWQLLKDSVPIDSPARCPHGYYWCAYKIAGNIRKLSSQELIHIVKGCEVRHTGWPMFISISRPEIAPYPFEGSVECWLGNDPIARFPDAAHSDFWRVSSDGLAFILRGYQEDGSDALNAGRPITPPGTRFDISLPIWRVGEVILHAEKFARNIADAPATVTFVAQYEGLAGRTLTSLGGERLLFDSHVARQNSIRLEGSFVTDSIGTNLPEIVSPMLTPLYGLFDFFEPPATIYSQELEKMRKGHY